MQADAIIKELILLDGKTAARIQCESSLIPAPGQYLLAYAYGSDTPLAGSIFSATSFTDGFLCAPPIPESWTPGTRLALRGPLGRGFDLPITARRIALIAFDDSPHRLLALFDSIRKQDAAVVLVCKNPPDDLPLEIEVQPMNALSDVCNWADYIAFDMRRESLPELKKMLGEWNPLPVKSEAQVLVRMSMPCGALAECGVCTVGTRHGQLLACKDGPVFNLNDLLD